jgi:hypothetical protein
VLRRRVQRLGSRRRWNAVSFCTKDRVLKIAVRFCTKEEEVLKIESFREDGML